MPLQDFLRCRQKYFLWMPGPAEGFACGLWLGGDGAKYKICGCTDVVFPAKNVHLYFVARMCLFPKTKVFIFLSFFN